MRILEAKNAHQQQVKLLRPEDHNAAHLCSLQRCAAARTAQEGSAADEAAWAHDCRLRLAITAQALCKHVPLQHNQCTLKETKTLKNAPQGRRFGASVQT